jgi:hypothetical protein
MAPALVLATPLARWRERRPVARATALTPSDWIRYLRASSKKASACGEPDWPSQNSAFFLMARG